MKSHVQQKHKWVYPKFNTKLPLFLCQFSYEEKIKEDMSCKLRSLAMKKKKNRCREEGFKQQDWLMVMVSTASSSNSF